MVIQTISKKYEVIKTLSGSDRLRFYLCREAQEQGKTDTQQRYLLVEVSEETLKKEFLLYFIQPGFQKEKRKPAGIWGRSTVRETGDFAECFTGKECLWLVFLYHEGKNLTEYLTATESQLFTERLELSRRLMERIAKQNPSPYFLHEVLRPENLVITESFDVYFRYLFQEPEMLNSCTPGEACVRLGRCLELLFDQELDNGVSIDLTVYVDNLKKGMYDSFVSAYRDYRKLYDMFMSLLEDETMKPENWLIQRWEQLKSMLKYLPRLLYAALLIVLFLVLFYRCVKPRQADLGWAGFARIGTMELREPGPEKTAEEEQTETLREETLQESETEVLESEKTPKETPEETSEELPEESSQEQREEMG